MNDNKNEARNPPQTASGASASQEKKGLQAKHIVLILGILVIITAAVVAVIVLTQSKNSLPIATDSYQPVVNEDNLDDVMNSIHEKVEMGMFETHMNVAWTFPDGKSPSDDAVMGNSQNNNYPFWFDVTVNNEVAYRSDLLPVGSQVKEIILQKDLDAGTYPAVVTVHMLDDNGEAIEGNMGFNITITVLK
jgi:hypothetical protein